MARGRSSGGRSSSPAPSRSYSSSSAPAQTATRGNPTQHNKPLAHPPAAASSSPAAARPAASAPVQQQQQQQGGGGGGMLSGLAGTMMSGMAFGTGSAVAHRAIDGIMGPREVQHTHAPAAEAASSSSRASRCQDQSAQFASCMKDNQGSIASCQFLFDSLSQCQREEREAM